MRARVTRLGAVLEFAIGHSEGRRRILLELKGLWIVVWSQLLQHSSGMVMTSIKDSELGYSGVPALLQTPHHPTPTVYSSCSQGEEIKLRLKLCAKKR